MTDSLRTSYLGTAYYRVLQTHLLAPMQKWGLSPNQLTLIGVTAAVLVPFGFMVHPIAGFLLLLTSAVMDSLDGLVARQRRQVSRFGAFLDSSLDRFSDFFYLLGFWLLLWPDPRRLAATLLMLLALLLTLMISYVKARAESLGSLCPSGLMGRVGRVIFLLAWSFLIAIFPRAEQVLLWCGFPIYIALASATLLRRIVHVRRKLLDIHTSPAATQDGPGSCF